MRFARSPMQEVVSSVTVLAASPRAGLHRRWAEQARARVDPLPLDVLRAVVGCPRYLPDFLFPVPDRMDTTFDTELARVRATPVDTVRTELDRARGGAPLGPVLRPLYDDPERGLGTLADQLLAYWRTAIEPVWPRLRSLLDADVEYRSGQLASGGVAEVLRTLHPRMRYADAALRLGFDRWNSTSNLGAAGLLLVPCVFTWPALAFTKDVDQPMLTYGPRGVGRVWAGTPDGSPPLAQLLGRSRAALLAHLDLPVSTTQLTVRLGLTAPAISEHLSVLRRAGLVTSRRSGRSVLYRRTPLADQLLLTAEGSVLP